MAWELSSKLWNHVENVCAFRVRICRENCVSLFMRIKLLIVTVYIRFLEFELNSRKWTTFFDNRANQIDRKVEILLITLFSFLCRILEVKFYVHRLIFTWTTSHSMTKIDFLFLLWQSFSAIEALPKISALTSRFPQWRGHIISGNSFVVNSQTLNATVNIVI